MQKSEEVGQVEEVPNGIALAFDDFGVGSSGEDWFCSDYLKAYHLELYEKVQKSNCEEVAERLLADLMVQVSSDDSEHKEKVLAWIEGLRELKNATDLRTISERPNLERGKVPGHGGGEPSPEHTTPWRD